MTITVSRSTILDNRRDNKDDPAWVLIDDADGSQRRVAFADFGTFRLVQETVKPGGSSCYIETDSQPLSVSTEPRTVVK